VWRTFWKIMLGMRVARAADPSMGIRNRAPAPRWQRWSEGEAVRLVKCAWRLEDPATYTGTVFGLTTGTYLDLPNINFADNPSISYSSKSHLLTVTDTVAGVTDTVSVKNASGSFTAQSDGNGGTLITDPPPSAKVAVSNDAFVFASNLGENPSANFNAHNDGFDPLHSESAELAAMLTQTHEDGINSVAHDVVDLTQHHAALSAQSHHVLL
jgi:hypothetical protein